MMEWIKERMLLTPKACEAVGNSIRDAKVSICFPLEYKTAVLAYELSKFCELRVTKFDEYTTKPSAVEWLKDKGVEILSKDECLTADYYMDCVAMLTGKARKQGLKVGGVIELTRSGVERLKSMNNFTKGISLDDSNIKGLGENRHGTAFGLLDALVRLNLYFPEKDAFVIGFGRVGEGCAEILRKLGCNVSVYDIDEIKCAIAEYSGYRVKDLQEGLSSSDIIVTATGRDSVISDFSTIKNGAILCNMGAGRYEIDVRRLKDYRKITINEHITKYERDNYFYVLCDSMSVNLTMANGTPVEIMDKTFALSVFALEYIVKTSLKD